MLVLSRRPGERLTLLTSDGEIEILIVTAEKGGKTRIGIDAPKKVEVYRSELMPEVHRQKASAAETEQRIAGGAVSPG